MFSILATAALATAMVAANPAVTPSTCDFGERHPDAAEELTQYEFLVGNHEVQAYRYDPENKNWGQGYLTTRWNGWWALGGFAIADEWFDVQFPGQPETLGRGINLRMWDGEKSQWSNMWMHTNTAQTTELISTVEDDGKMVMYQVYPEAPTKTRVEFETHDDGSWTRIAYNEAEDGSLTPTGKLVGIKLACEE